MPARARSLRASSERELLGQQRSKSALVANILKAARNEALSMSASPVVVTASRELLQAYRQLAKEPITPEMQAEVRRFYREEFEPELAKRLAIAVPEGSLLPTTPAAWYLHYHYIAKGEKPYGKRRTNRSSTDMSAYGQIMARVAPAFQAQIDRLGQENVVLVDPETLDVFFTLEQSASLGTNLGNGPYASSRLAELAQGPAPFAERRRLPGRRLRDALPGAWQPEGVCRHAHLRWAEDGRAHDAAAADRADQRRAVGQPPMASGRPRADGRGLPARTGFDDAHRLAVPDRGSRGVSRDAAPLDAHEPDRRHRREAWNDHPHRPGEA